MISSTSLSTNGLYAFPKSSDALLVRSIVAATRPDPEILAIVGHNFDAAIVAVGLEIRRLVRDCILAAEFVLDFGKRVGHIPNLKRKECPSASRIGNALQHLVA